MTIHILKIVRDNTKQANKEYLQVYFDIISENGELVHRNGSFFVNSKNKESWEEKFADDILTRKESEIKELERKLEELKKK